MTRITIPLDAKHIERLRKLTEQLDISQARLVGCLLALPDAEIARIVKANVSMFDKERAARFEEKRIARAEKAKKVKDAAKILSAMTPEQLDAILRGQK